MREKINDPVRLQLMLEAIANIEEFLSNTPNYESFSTNNIMRILTNWNIMASDLSII